MQVSYYCSKNKFKTEFHTLDSIKFKALELKYAKVSIASAYQLCNFQSTICMFGCKDILQHIIVQEIEYC